MEKVVTIMTFGSAMEAEIYRSLLESAGIAAQLQNDLATQVLPSLGELVSVKLLVAEEDEARAREVLSAKFDAEEFKRETK